MDEALVTLFFRESTTALLVEHDTLALPDGQLCPLDETWQPAAISGETPDKFVMVQGRPDMLLVGVGRLAGWTPLTSQQQALAADYKVFSVCYAADGWALWVAEFPWVEMDEDPGGYALPLIRSDIAAKYYMARVFTPWIAKRAEGKLRDFEAKYPKDKRFRRMVDAMMSYAVNPCNETAQTIRDVAKTMPTRRFRDERRMLCGFKDFSDVILSDMSKESANAINKNVFELILASFLDVEGCGACIRFLSAAITGYTGD